MSSLRPAIRLLERLSGVAAACYVAYLVVLSAQRIPYPFELEWMEGGSLQHVLRLLEGRPLYPPPSIDFIPFPYPPLYYGVSGLFARVLGADFLALRLVSLLSILGAAGVVGAFVWRETRRALPALLAAGAFCATFRASGVYFDVARVDSLFLFLTLLALFLLRFQRSRLELVMAGLVAAMAVMTKQTALVVLAPVGVWCLWADARGKGSLAARFQRSLLFGSTALLVIGVATAALEAGDAEFFRYVVSVQQDHPLRPGMIGWFFGRDLMGPLPIACLFVVGYLLLAALGSRRTEGFYVAMLLGVVVASLVPRVKVGGAANNLPPVHAVLILLFAITAAQVESLVHRGRDEGPDGGRGAGPVDGPGEATQAGVSPGPRTGRRPEPDDARVLALSVVPIAWAMQLALLAYSPEGLLPTAADREAGWRLVERIRGIEGDVLIPAQGYLAGLAGKRVFAHQRPTFDYAHSGLAEAVELERGYAEAIRSQRFAAIIDSTSGFLRGYPGGGVLQSSYLRSGHVLGAPDVLKPISGFGVQPGLLWLPRDAGPAGAPPGAGQGRSREGRRDR